MSQAVTLIPTRNEKNCTPSKLVFKYEKRTCDGCDAETTGSKATALPLDGDMPSIFCSRPFHPSPLKVAFKHQAVTCFGQVLWISHASTIPLMRN